MPEYFTTKFGKKIKIDNEHYKFTQKLMGEFKTATKLRGFIEAASSNIDQSKSSGKIGKEKFRDSRSKLSLRGYMIRYVVSQILVDLLETASINPRFARGLDIGCGFGIQPMVWRGMGIVEHATAIDVVDRCSSINSSSLRSAHRKMKIFAFLEPYVERLAKKPYETLSDFQKALVEKATPPRLEIKNAMSYLLPKEIYKRKFVREPKLDHFIEGDIYQLEQKFDLITALSSLEWFRLEDIFPKISSMLSDDGIFYMYVGSWWCSTESKMFGHFPYFKQRLTRDDFKRYAEENFPDEVESMMVAYDFYDPLHPTFSNIIALGMANGLVPVIYRCDIPSQLYKPKMGIGPLGYAIDDPDGFKAALNDINEFRPDVRPEDLLNTLIHVVFRKAKSDNRGTTQTYADDLAKNEFKYRPSGFLGKILRDMAIKFLLR